MKSRAATATLTAIEEVGTSYGEDWAGDEHSFWFQVGNTSRAVPLTKTYIEDAIVAAVKRDLALDTDLKLRVVRMQHRPVQARDA